LAFGKFRDGDRGIGKNHDMQCTQASHGILSGVLLCTHSVPPVAHASYMHLGCFSPL